MTADPQKELKDLQPTKDFFIGIDSDGCAFDTMEIKQKECFCPNVIKYFNLQSVSKYARETWEFVNLYSKSRGINRFLALIEAVQLLGERPEVKARQAKMPDMSRVVGWTKNESKLGNPALEKYVQQVNDPVMDNLLEWSVAVNKTVEDIVYGIAPFPYVRESLVKLQEKADAIVVSQTPVEALTREWEENDIDQYVRVIAGQEYGKKSEHLAWAAKNKYPDEKILMIGDAPGDRKAADSNGVLFFPINPGHEEESWQRFYQEALDKFFNGTFQGEYQEKLVQEFESYLPATPPWKK
ncbi:MAG: HAD family hydrolase [Candidatus Cyclobacteriaceae bacterium M3_2C_046]